MCCYCSAPKSGNTSTCFVPEDDDMLTLIVGAASDFSSVTLYNCMWLSSWCWSRIALAQAWEGVLLAVCLRASAYLHEMPHLVTKGTILSKGSVVWPPTTRTSFDLVHWFLWLPKSCNSVCSLGCNVNSMLLSGLPALTLCDCGC